ncbi:MAG TPA: YjfB family protein [Oscillospiraceae bacterium]|nr:YjfB family protein [Oscillospiraceae bacterium]
MDLTMGIAAMSMSLSQASLQSEVSLKVMDKTMDAASSQAAQLISDFSQSASVPFGTPGYFFDARA